MAAEHETSYSKILSRLNDEMHDGKNDTIQKILNYVQHKKGSVVKVLTEEYKVMAETNRRMIFNLDDEHITFGEYFSRINKLYQDDETFGCLERATNSYEAQIYLYNVLQTIYGLLYPNTLQFFDKFVIMVVDYMRHSQNGHICVFDGTKEVLPYSYFENLIVGCFLAISYLKAEQCRIDRSVIASLGYIHNSKRHRVLMKQFKKSCSFFNKVDTTTFQRKLREQMGYVKREESATGMGPKSHKRKTHKKKPHHKKSHRHTIRKRRKKHNKTKHKKKT